MNRAKLVAELRRDEGVKAKPYRDTEGILTIGVGRNLEDVGLSDDEMDYLLTNDINRALRWCQRQDWWPMVDTDARQRAIVNMVFNLGPTRFIGFRKMLEAIRRGDWPAAADEALDSKWADQVGSRAHRIAAMLRNGLEP